MLNNAESNTAKCQIRNVNIFEFGLPLLESKKGERKCRCLKFWDIIGIVVTGGVSTFLDLVANYKFRRKLKVRYVFGRFGTVTVVAGCRGGKRNLDDICFSVTKCHCLVLTCHALFNCHIDHIKILQLVQN